MGKSLKSAAPLALGPIGMTAGLMGGSGLMGGGSPQPSMKTKYADLGLADFQVPYVKEGLTAAQTAFQNPEDSLGYGTARGDYLTPESNPYLSGAVERAQADTTQNYMQGEVPSLFANYAKSGMLKSGAFGQALGSSEERLQDRLAETAERMYGAQYGRERALQESAAQRFDPLARSSQYMNIVGKGFGGSRQLPVQEKDKMAGMLGGALSGASMGSAAGPYGALGGALLGGFLGSRN